MENVNWNTIKDMLSTGRLSKSDLEKRYEAEGHILLTLAAKEGDVAVLEQLLDAGAEIEATTSLNGRTALICAAMNGYLAVVEILHRREANIEAPSRHAGYTALSAAAGGNNLAVVEYLCIKGAELEARDNNGDTALSIAAKRGYLEVVRALCDKGALLDAKNNKGLTPIDCAEQSCKHQVVNFLKAQKTLIGPAANGDTVAVTALCENGLLTQKFLPEDVATALNKAASNDRVEVFDILLNGGAKLERLNIADAEALVKKNNGLRISTKLKVMSTFALYNRQYKTDWRTYVIKHNSEILIANLVLNNLPIDKNSVDFSVHKECWCWFLYNGIGGVPAETRLNIVRRILERYNRDYATIFTLKNIDHTNNRSIIEFTDPDTRAAIQNLFFFDNRYELFLDEAPVHISDTSIVIRALDHGFLNQCLKHFDDCGADVLSEDEFIDCVLVAGLFSESINSNGRNDEMKEAFNRFDIDNNRKIDREEFKTFVRSTIGERRRVVFKFMKNKEQFEKEYSIRDRINSPYLMNILNNWDSERDQEFRKWLDNLSTIKGKNLGDYKYGILMPEGDRSLHSIYMHEKPDLNHIRAYLQDLARGLDDLHSASIFHLDVKLLNALRVNGNRIVIIDMDAAVKNSGQNYQTFAGAKFSSGVLPPEMFCKLDAPGLQQYKQYWAAAVDSQPSLRKKVKPLTYRNSSYVVKCFDEKNPRPEQLPYELVTATAAIDSWAFGVLMFQLLCRDSFVPVDADDDLRAGSASFLTWTDDELASFIENSMERFTGYSDAIDLLKKLLRVDASDRLNMKEVLQDPFFTIDNAKHLAGQIKAVERKVDAIASKISEMDNISTDVLRQIRTTEKVLLRGILENPGVPTCFILLPDKINETNSEMLSGWLNQLDKSIEELPGNLLNAVDSYWNKRVEVDQVLYLYLVDEYTMQPVDGDNYPIAIRKSKHSEFLECALPLLRMSWKAISIYSGIHGFLALSGTQVPEILDSIIDSFQSAAGILDANNSKVNVADFNDNGSSNSSSNLNMGYVKKVYGDAQRKLKKLLSIEDKDNDFCGLGCVAYRGYSCWTLPENREIILSKADEEIEADVQFIRNKAKEAAATTTSTTAAAATTTTTTAGTSTTITATTTAATTTAAAAVPLAQPPPSPPLSNSSVSPLVQSQPIDASSLAQPSPASPLSNNSLHLTLPSQTSVTSAATPAQSSSQPSQT